MSKIDLIVSIFCLIVSLNFLKSQEFDPKITTTEISETESSMETLGIETTTIEALGSTETAQSDDVTTEYPWDDMKRVTWADPRLKSLRIPSVPLGILEDHEGQKVRKRCQCIQKRLNHKVVNVTFVPLNPSIDLPGEKKSLPVTAVI